MKTKSIIFSIIVALVSVTNSIAQNYKAQNNKAPMIDASGIITHAGKHIGSVTKDGIVSDSTGTKVAYVNAEGILVDAKTGKKLGKAEKNGDFLPYFHETPDKGWSVSAPMNGTCLVKDKDGKIVAEVHEDYKHLGACAVHCLARHSDHGKVMEKETNSAAYSCPMHPDVTSEKPGKCSKCGMDLEKKK